MNLSQKLYFSIFNPYKLMILLKSQTEVFGLNGIYSIEGLLSFLESNQLSFSIDLISLLNLYIEAMQSSDLSISEFLEYLLTNGLISQMEYDRLLNEFIAMDLDLNSKLSKFIVRFRIKPANC